MFKHLALIPLAALLVALASALSVSQASAANDAVVKMALQEFRVDISSATVQVGTPVRFEIANKGVIPHEIVIEKAGTVNQPLTDGSGKAIVENIAPGTSKTITWTFTEPGTYWAACHVPGHFEAGMKIAFTVVPASAAAPATTNNPPATTNNPPASTNNPPATTNNAPATNNPPATTSQAPATTDAPAAATSDTPPSAPSDQNASDVFVPYTIGGSRAHLR